MACTKNQIEQYQAMLLKQGIVGTVLRHVEAICGALRTELDPACWNLVVAGRFTTDDGKELLILPPDEAVLKDVIGALKRAKLPGSKSVEATGPKSYSLHLARQYERFLRLLRRHKTTEDPKSGRRKTGDPRPGDKVTIQFGKGRFNTIEILAVRRDRHDNNRLVLTIKRSSHNDDDYDDSPRTLVGKHADAFVSELREIGYEPGQSLVMTVDEIRRRRHGEPTGGRPEKPDLTDQQIEVVKQATTSLMTPTGNKADDGWIRRATTEGLTDSEIRERFRYSRVQMTGGQHDGGSFSMKFGDKPEVQFTKGNKTKWSLGWKDVLAAFRWAYGVRS